MRDRIKKYFKSFPRWTLWMIGVGIPLAAVGVGVLLIAIGIVGIIAYASRPSDAQMDAWLDEDLAALKAKALAKTGLDASELIRDQDALIGFPFKGVANAHKAQRRGKDGFIRFTPLSVAILNYTVNQIVVYECVFDLTTGKALNEAADEYFYRHVVGVRTRTLCETKDGKPEEIGEVFQLTTSAGTSVEVLLTSSRVIQEVGGEIQMTRAEKAIQAVRKMLREKGTLAA